MELGQEVGRLAAPYAAAHDLEGTFVSEGYDAVRKLNFGALGVPKDLGGGGQGLEGICRAQAAISAGCASTSLAIAMHNHAVLTFAWRWARGDTEAEGVLRRVVEENILLSASGTLNPSAISIEAEPVDGGYLVSGRRRLVSGAPGTDYVVSAAKIVDDGPVRPITLLAPLSGGGVTIVDDWNALGMRGSGTNSVTFDGVFVPRRDALYVNRHHGRDPSTQAAEDRSSEAAQPDTDEEAEHRHALQASDGPAESEAQDNRPSGLRLPGLHISLAIIASTYLGLADAICDRAISAVARSNRADNPGAGHLTGLMVHEVQVGWWSLEGMIRHTTDDSLGSSEQMIRTQVGKRQMVLSSIRVVETAMELLGSASYMRGTEYERALRDVRAGITHPLPPEGSLVEIGWEALEVANRERA